MVSILYLLRQCDIFGYHMRLNFNRKGYQHKTWIGGFVSICLHTTYYVYILSLLIKMFTHSDDRTFVKKYYNPNASFTLQ